MDGHVLAFPNEPIDSVINSLQRFLHIGSAGGIVLPAAFSPLWLVVDDLSLLPLA